MVGAWVSRESGPKARLATHKGHGDSFGFLCRGFVYVSFPLSVGCTVSFSMIDGISYLQRSLRLLIQWISLIMVMLSRGWIDWLFSSVIDVVLRTNFSIRHLPNTQRSCSS